MRNLEKVSNNKNSEKILKIIARFIVAIAVVIIIRKGISLGSITSSPIEEQKSLEIAGAVAEIRGDVQIVVSDVGRYAYESLVVQAGMPVKWYLEADSGEINGCNDTIIIPALGIKKGLIEGRTLIEFTPAEPGDMGFSCWMEMINSNIRVVDDLNDL